MTLRDIPGVKSDTRLDDGDNAVFDAIELLPSKAEWVQGQLCAHLNGISYADGSRYYGGWVFAVEVTMW